MNCPICDAYKSSQCDCDRKAVELAYELDERDDELEECRDEIRALKRFYEEQMSDPSIEEIGNACLSFRHDCGLMSAEDRLNLQVEAVNWLNAWRKALDV